MEEMISNLKLHKNRTKKTSRSSITDRLCQSDQEGRIKRRMKVSFVWSNIGMDTPTSSVLLDLNTRRLMPMPLLRETMRSSEYLP